MNDATTVSGMSLSTPEGCVTAGVELFAKAEVKVQQAQKAMLQLVDVLEAGNQLLMLEMGNLKTGLMKAKAKAAAGFLAQGEALIWELHRMATDIAIANDLDPPHSESGPGR